MKQTFIKTIFFLSISIIPLFLEADIDTQIEAIRNAPLTERFKLMNAFKQEIIDMKEEERIQAITQLKSITESKYGDRALHEIKTHIKTHHNKETYSRGENNEIEDEVANETENEIENEAEDHIEDDIEDEAQTEDKDDD
jgi:hypothetical protein